MVESYFMFDKSTFSKSMEVFLLSMVREHGNDACVCHFDGCAICFSLSCGQDVKTVNIII